MIDILFIVKDKDVSNINKQIRSIGLVAQNNSDFISTSYFNSKVVFLKSADYIDKVIKEYEPKIVVIETIWTSINHLKNIVSNNSSIEKLIIRIHSDYAYFAVENLGFKWVFDFLNASEKFYFASNCKNFSESMSIITNREIFYLPNIYEYTYSFNSKVQNDMVDVGIIGSVRILKNHMTQVISALQFAKESKKRVNIHINNLSSDLGRTISSNINYLMKNFEYAKLVVQDYKSGSDYKNFVQSLDFGMQLSFTETFNNVAADFATFGVPIVISDSIDWLNNNLKTSATEVSKISKVLHKAYSYRNNENFAKTQYSDLQKYNDISKNIWMSFLIKNIK